MRNVSPDWNERGVWLPFYTAEFQRKVIDGLNDNVSGLTFSDASETLFTVTNRPPLLAELTVGGELLRTIPLVGGNDIEGVTHVAGDQFVVVDEGKNRLSWVEVGRDTREIDLNIAPSLPLDFGVFDNMGFEGLSWDQRHRRLVVVQEMWPVRVVMIDGLDEASPIDTSNMTLSEWRPSQVLGHVAADLSSVTVHDATGNILLLSDMSSELLEYSPSGELISAMLLWAGRNGLSANVPQAEGVAIGPNGDIFLVSEPNHFYRFVRAPGANWATR